MKQVLTNRIVLEDYARLTQDKRSGVRGFFYKKYMRELDSITDEDIRIIASKCIMKERMQLNGYLHFDKFGRVYTSGVGDVSRTDKPNCEKVKWDECFYIATIRGDKKTAIFYSAEEWVLP